MPLSGMTTENYTGSINWGRATSGLVAQPNTGGASARTPVKKAARAPAHSPYPPGKAPMRLLPHNPGGQQIANLGVGPGQNAGTPGEINRQPIQSIVGTKAASGLAGGGNEIFRTISAAGENSGAKPVPTTPPKDDAGAKPGSTIGNGQVAFLETGAPVIGAPIRFPHGRERPATYTIGGRLVFGVPNLPEALP